MWKILKRSTGKIGKALSVRMDKDVDFETLIWLC